MTVRPRAYVRWSCIACIFLEEGDPILSSNSARSCTQSSFLDWVIKEACFRMDQYVGIVHNTDHFRPKMVENSIYRRLKVK